VIESKVLRRIFASEGDENGMENITKVSESSTVYNINIAPKVMAEL
jgi:hypothetical protein